MVLGDVVVWRLFYLAAKPSSVGVDVDGLSYPLHRPTTNGCQTRVHNSLYDAALFYLVAKLLLRESLPQQARIL
jgi:hypothetical protein